MISDRCFELTISKSNIVSAVETLLSAWKVVLSNEDVLDIEFGDMKQELVPIKVHFNKEVTTNKYNG